MRASKCGSSKGRMLVRRNCSSAVVCEVEVLHGAAGLPLGLVQRCCLTPASQCRTRPSLHPFHLPW